MPNSIGITTWERLIYYHRLIAFPSKKEHFLKLPKRTITSPALPSCKKL